VRGHGGVFISPPSLLIVDDDGAFRETLCSVFAPRGFNTLTARDGDEALEIVRRQPVHVLLTDMHMPRLSGLETIRRIRQCRLILPCILLSAGLDDGLVEEARDLQAFSVLRKPVRFSELTGVVRQALRVTYGWVIGEDSAANES
jgi:CheY-like chemotaxis protein